MRDKQKGKYTKIKKTHYIYFRYIYMASCLQFVEKQYLIINVLFCLK